MTATSWKVYVAGYEIIGLEFEIVDAGFDFVCDFDGQNSFEKRITRAITLRKSSVCFTIVVPGVGLEPTKACARGS